jgi:hypothetical protein
MSTAFDVPSEGSLSLNGRATTYRPSIVRVGHGLGNAPHMFFPIPTNAWWDGPSSSSQKRARSACKSVVFT